jgi:hypothetical protein
MRHLDAKLATVAILFLGVAGCSELQSLANETPAVASAAQEICQNLVPAAEATANAVAKGGALAKVEDTETNYINPACTAVETAANAVDSGWLANVVANLTSTAATGQPGTAPTGPSASK